MDDGLGGAGGEGLGDEAAGAGIKRAVEAVGGFGRAEFAGGAGGDRVLDSERCAG
jgi:hypothetical protein